VPRGADPHEFQASAQQAARLRDADLVVSSGLGLEQGLEDVLAGAAADGVSVLELGPSLDPRPLDPDAEDHGEDHGDGAGLDPHWWLDPIRAARAVELVAERLGTIADGDWEARAEAYVAELQALDQEIERGVAEVPAERRKLVTSHESLGYFADRYGFEVIGVIIPGGSTAAEPSAAGFAQLVEAIRREDVPAIFGETTVSTGLSESLAREVGRDVQVVVLYTESLDDPGTPADSYVGMMRTNLERIVDALS
jgi:zinc/manganese transport system substrate-binding protein